MLDNVLEFEEDIIFVVVVNEVVLLFEDILVNGEVEKVTVLIGDNDLLLENVL